MDEKIKLAMVDDHVLLRNALASLINSFTNCQVVCEANNGSDLIAKLSKLPSTQLPEVVLLDLNMPLMDGYDTSIWLRDNFPEVHVLMLTMYDSELTLIRLLQAGVKGFLKKDIDPAELKFAINSVMQSGYYYSTQTAGRLANLFRNNAKDNLRIKHAMLEDNEIGFLKLACSDLTYKEIAQKMRLTPRSVDALRDQLFMKLDVKSRVGVAMVAIRNGVVSIAT
ncbi:MAG TPA: response regulator transcription factor [Flavisolibacter sp.]|nr:response regulator transcription factor [Flavisolibacter sp.]